MIEQFTGQYRFLSNFHVEPGFQFSAFGRLVPTVEHAYQAAKAVKTEDRRYILGVPTARAAKRAGRRIARRDDWEKVKVTVMGELLRRKFSDPALRTKLLNTGEELLIEGNDWGDRFWGAEYVSTENLEWTGDWLPWWPRDAQPANYKRLWLGANTLGTLLMALRGELRTLRGM